MYFTIYVEIIFVFIEIPGYYTLVEPEFFLFMFPYKVLYFLIWKNVLSLGIVN